MTDSAQTQPIWNGTPTPRPTSARPHPNPTHGARWLDHSTGRPGSCLTDWRSRPNALAPVRVAEAHWDAIRTDTQLGHHALAELSTTPGPVLLTDTSVVFLVPSLTTPWPTLLTGIAETPQGPWDWGRGLTLHLGTGDDTLLLPEPGQQRRPLPRWLVEPDGTGLPHLRRPARHRPPHRVRGHLRPGGEHPAASPGWHSPALPGDSHQPRRLLRATAPRGGIVKLPLPTADTASSGWAYAVDLATKPVRALRSDIVTRCRSQLVSQRLPVDDTALDGIELVFAELLTNVLRHVVGRGLPSAVEVIVVLEPADVLLTVLDCSRSAPCVTTAEPGREESGLGLHLIEALTRGRWGWSESVRGKAVWARCPLDATPDGQDRVLQEPTPRPISEAADRLLDRPSLVPAHDGSHWLTGALSEEDRARALSEWGAGGLTRIPAGVLFRAIAVPPEHATRAIAHLAAAGCPLGPVLTHGPTGPAHPAATVFLVPTGADLPLAHGPDELSCPRPGTQNADHRWIVAPDGSGQLTDPHELHRALAATRRTSHLPHPLTQPTARRPAVS